MYSINTENMSAQLYKEFGCLVSALSPFRSQFQETIDQVMLWCIFFSILMRRNYFRMKESGFLPKY